MLSLTSESDGSVHRLFEDVRMNARKEAGIYQEGARAHGGMLMRCRRRYHLAESCRRSGDRLKEQAINEHQTHSAAKLLGSRRRVFPTGAGGDWVEKLRTENSRRSSSARFAELKSLWSCRVIFIPVTVRLHKDRVMVKDLQKGHQDFMKYSRALGKRCPERQLEAIARYPPACALAVTTPKTRPTVSARKHKQHHKHCGRKQWCAAPVHTD